MRAGGRKQATMKPPSDTKTARSSDPWAPYVPCDEAPWDLRRVVHLHRRAGFAATWGEIQRDLKDGPEPASTACWPARRPRTACPRSSSRPRTCWAESAATSSDPARLKAWWLYRMLFGPDPLGERLTLMWHNHFATSNLKVGDLAFMRRQNELFRRSAGGRSASCWAPSSATRRCLSGSTPRATARATPTRTWPAS